jgi:hypothetical protein
LGRPLSGSNIIDMHEQSRNHDYVGQLARLSFNPSVLLVVVDVYASDAGLNLMLYILRASPGSWSKSGMYYNVPESWARGALNFL